MLLLLPRTAEVRTAAAAAAAAAAAGRRRQAFLMVPVDLLGLEGTSVETVSRVDSPLLQGVGGVRALWLWVLDSGNGCHHRNIRLLFAVEERKPNRVFLLEHSTVLHLEAQSCSHPPCFSIGR